MQSVLKIEMMIMDSEHHYYLADHKTNPWVAGSSVMYVLIDQ